MIRAIFEGVGYSVLDIADRLGGMGVEVQRVSASGGLARLDPINQIKSDMLGVPVAPDRGARDLRPRGRARWPASTSATGRRWRRRPPPASAAARVFEPEPARTQMYRDFFAIYRGLYDQLRELFVSRDALIAQHAEVLRTGLARSENL